MSRLAFFVGKGGVGKTTIAAAYATHTAAADSSRRVLLVSTDPAHSLGDVLQKKLGGSPKSIQLGPRHNLWAWELNASALFRDLLREYKQGILEIVERGSLFTADEISPLLDTALPGMSEIAALFALRNVIGSAKYSHIVVDTAPFGHTVRLFGLPEQFARLLKFLELAAERDLVLAEHFGGVPPHPKPQLLEIWSESLQRLAESLSAADFFVVTTPEKFALNESVRSINEIRATAFPFRVKGVVLNRAVLRAGKCKHCREKLRKTQLAKSFLRKQFTSVPIRLAEDPGFPILGAEALNCFAEHVFLGKSLRLNPQHPKRTGSRSGPQLSSCEWPLLSSPTSFVLGKGGVGKTTISAALGFHQRKMSSEQIQICSVDPAPSLDDIFLTVVSDTPTVVLGDPDFRASELDSVALFKKWVAEIREGVDSATSSELSGVHVDLSFERQMLSALLDIVPPGLDEVLAIFHISDLRANSSTRIIIDMAPTGHALELLRMPERIQAWARVLLKSLAAHRKLALARNAAVRIAELELRARELAAALKNSGEVSLFAVMLPEPLPDRETQRLFSSLQQLGFRPLALFVNRTLLAEDVAGCARCRISWEWQSSLLADLKKRLFTEDVYVVRNFAREIAGNQGLRAITDKLWRLN